MKLFTSCLLVMLIVVLAFVGCEADADETNSARVVRVADLYDARR